MRIWKPIRRIIFIVTSIGISLGIIFFFRWVGLKGLLGFAIGVLLTGFMFMTDNLYIRVFMEYILDDKK